MAAGGGLPLGLLAGSLLAAGTSFAISTRRRGRQQPGAADGGATAAADGQPGPEQRAEEWLQGTVQGSTGYCVADLEVLRHGDLVYLRTADGRALNALLPASRLELTPVGGAPDVPTIPLEPTSVWTVQRQKQEVKFTLLGPHGERYALRADPNSPHGVALGRDSSRKRFRFAITARGLASVPWPHHVLQLQALPVQLVDARAVASVRATMGRQVASLAAQLEAEELDRMAAEARNAALEGELVRVRDEATSQVAELRAQLDTAVRTRHAAEREAATLQTQRADEAARAKAAQARNTQLEAERRQLQAHMQGLVAGHAEELRTLHTELRLAREANESLKRAMSEQVLALQGALELRDARIIVLEEENDRMDTVLQVIQTQLGGGTPPPPVRDAASSEAGAVGSCSPSLTPHAGCCAAAADDAAEPSTVDDAVAESPPQTPAAPRGLRGLSACGESAEPLWKSLLDSGALSVTALKESLALSRRATADEHASAASRAAALLAPAASAPAAQPDAPAPSAAPGLQVAPGVEEAEQGPRAWPFFLSPGRSDGNSSGRSSADGSGARVLVTGEWGSGGGAGGLKDGDGEQAEFVPAALHYASAHAAPAPGCGAQLLQGAQVSHTPPPPPSLLAQRRY